MKLTIGTGARRRGIGSGQIRVSALEVLRLCCMFRNPGPRLDSQGCANPKRVNSERETTCKCALHFTMRPYCQCVTPYCNTTSDHRSSINSKSIWLETVVVKVLLYFLRRLLHNALRSYFPCPRSAKASILHLDRDSLHI